MMDEHEGQDAEVREGDDARTPSVAKRLSELREGARRGRHLALLIEDPGSPGKGGRSRRKMLLLGAAGLVLIVGAGIVAAVAGGGGFEASPLAAGPSPTLAAPAGTTLAGAPTATRSKTAAGGTSATPTVDEGAPEGAVDQKYVYPGTLNAPPALVSPLRSAAHIVDHFGAPRGEGLVHAGVDLSLPGGGDAAVFAACTGTVTDVAHLDGYGDLAVVDCGNGWRTIYAQVSQITARSGDSVGAGETQLAMAKGPLHFEVRWGGSVVNPETLVDFTTAPTPIPATPAAGSTPEPDKSPTPKPATQPPSATTAPDGTIPPPDTQPTNPPQTATSVPPTATPLPPTATPTATPVPPTPTPTPRPPRPTPTPRPVIR